MVPGVHGLGGAGLAREPQNQRGAQQIVCQLLWYLLGATPSLVWRILVMGSTLPLPKEKHCTGCSIPEGRGDMSLIKRNSLGDNLSSPGLVLIHIQTPQIKTNIMYSQDLAGIAWPERQRAEQIQGWSRADRSASALAQTAGSVSMAP